MDQQNGLYRSSHEKMIGGVAGGLAEYANVDVTLIRIVFLLLVLVGGGGAILYIILWIVLPPDTQVYFENPKNPNMEENTTNGARQEPKSQPSQPQFKKKDDGSLIAGLILISLGVIFLVIRYVPRVDFGDLWPVILIVIGIVLLRNAFIAKKK